MYHYTLLKFKDFVSKGGHLTPIEEQIDVPFRIKRVYYITGVAQTAERGCHAHKNLQQVFICLNGAVNIRIKTPNKEEILTLNNPSTGLYLGPLVWSELFDFTEGSVLLVVASEHYSANDYIADYHLYLTEAQAVLQEGKSSDCGCPLRYKMRLSVCLQLLSFHSLT